MLELSQLKYPRKTGKSISQIVDDKYAEKWSIKKNEDVISSWDVVQHKYKEGEWDVHANTKT